MKHFFDWFTESGQRQQQAPWLILGKGPSYDLLHGSDVSGYRLMSLNHVVREGPVELAHMIDIDVAVDCAQAILDHAGMLVMPWYPHTGNLVGSKTLAQWVQEVPMLKQMDLQGRLLWYDLSQAKQRHGPGPVVKAAAFSAEAALNLLALAGVRKVRSLGIDGGTSYGNRFDDLKDTTRLNNGQPSYNVQFEGFARTIMATAIDFAPLNVESPIRVYVGSQEEQMLSVKVLEHSIRRHASMTVEVHPLHRAGIAFERPREQKNWPRTPFSFQRFAIPQLAGHRGRAIYLDSDMLVFRDIRALWTLPFEGADLLAAQAADGTSRKPQFSVMLLDCARLGWSPGMVVESLDSGRLSYEQLMHDMALAKQVRAGISPHWNSLEQFDAAQTCLLHYTDMSTQPWVYARNRHGHLWVRELLMALDSGFIQIDEVREHVARGWVRPSLLKQALAHKQRLSPLSAYGWLADRRFIAPYKSIPL